MGKNEKAVLGVANGQLALIAGAKAELAALEAGCKAEIADVAARWGGKIESASKRLAELEKELRGLCKQHRDDIFPKENSRVELTEGSLLWTIQQRVVKIKGMLANLKGAGLVEAINVVESVNWDRVEKLDDLTLAALGTRRKTEEIYGYEVKPCA